MSEPRKQLLFGLNDTPPWPTRFVAGLQHLMAIFGGIITAPLIISSGMGLSVTDSNYLITSALVISGLATMVQISKIGVVGSGMLSVQGTSFTFIGAILFAFFNLPETMSDAEKLGTIFGTSAICALIVLPLCFYISYLRHIFTPTVAGATVFLLGSTLVLNNINSLSTAFNESVTTFEGIRVLLIAATVFITTFILAYCKYFWLRMTSIVSGLCVGFIISLSLGLIDFSLLSELETTFIPVPFHFGFGFNWGVFLILFPIFIVTITETIGDLTATSSISQEPTSGPVYWERIRGGLLSDLLNSFVAALFSTFPNTTFSQNNGVIRLTGIASRKVGMITALLLIVLGIFPVIGGLFQLLPTPVLTGATMLMFLMVALAGLEIVHKQNNKRSWIIAISAVFGGWIISETVEYISFLHPQIQMFLQFSVSTGAFLAIALELILPVDPAVIEEHANEVPEPILGDSSQ